MCDAPQEFQGVSFLLQGVVAGALPHDVNLVVEEGGFFIGRSAHSAGVFITRYLLG